MSVYFIKGKGWRYDFIHKGARYTEAWFETKRAARQAEAEKRKEVKSPVSSKKMPTDIAFLDLVNRRLDHVQAYNTESHYRDVRYHCKRWLIEWNELICSDITTDMVESYLKMRLCGSAIVANKELQYLRALFNFGIKKKLFMKNPTIGIDFFPVERRKKYIPPKDDVIKAISVGNTEAQQYLWTIVLTAARMGEINGLIWDDIDFERRVVTLWTRKRKGGNREPREVPMVQKLFDILFHRFKSRNPEIPWVFWHTYWSRKISQWVNGPYLERKKLMSTLCDKADVKYFRYHALRHLTASVLDDLGIPIGVIQRILGHKNRRTTEIYLHSIGEAEREAMEKLENIPLFQNGSVPEPGVPTNMHLAFWNRKVNRPSYKKLEREVRQKGFAATGRKYGVSDNAVRKWLAIYEREEKGLFAEK
jgi:integrase